MKWEPVDCIVAGLAGGIVLMLVVEAVDGFFVDEKTDLQVESVKEVILAVIAIISFHIGRRDKAHNRKVDDDSDNS